MSIPSLLFHRVLAVCRRHRLGLPADFFGPTDELSCGPLGRLLERIVAERESAPEGTIFITREISGTQSSRTRWSLLSGENTP